MREVRDWLEPLGLAQYADSFTDNAIDADVLSELSDADLQELGVTALAHRKRLLKAIDALRSDGTMVVIAQRTQRVGEAQQVVVVRPDQVVRPHHRRQCAGEQIVDPAVAGEFLPLETTKADLVVQRRPQRAVGEA